MAPVSRYATPSRLFRFRVRREMPTALHARCSSRLERVVARRSFSCTLMAAHVCDTRYEPPYDARHDAYLYCSARFRCSCRLKSGLQDVPCPLPPSVLSCCLHMMPARQIVEHAAISTLRCPVIMSRQCLFRAFFRDALSLPRGFLV